MTAVETDHPAEVLLSLEGPRPQRRLTIAFRAILIIPAYLWLGLLGIAAGFAIIGIWVAALFTGRAPDALRTFVGRYVRYYGRFLAYAYLLTDRYPPFDLDADDYPLEVLLPPAGRLNRAAVFFRYFLMFPAWIVAGLAAAGLYVAMFFIWLIVLIKGTMPRSIFEAITAVQRYLLRAMAYATMLTSEYPHRLFGDKDVIAEPTSDAGLDAELPAFGAAAPPTGEPLTELPAQPRITRLVLSKAAKRIVALFIVLSVVTYVGLIAVIAVTTAQGNEAADRLQSQHAILEVAVTDFVSTTQSCGISGGPDCLHAADHKFAQALRDFRDDVRYTDYPRNALTWAHAVDEDASMLIRIVASMEISNDATEYQQLAVDFQTAANRFDSDYQDLYFALRFNGG